MARTLLTTCCFALLCSPGFAQLDIPPLPESPAFGQDGIAEPFQPEALTRGPVHEAFAEQINSNPSLGILVAQAPPEAIDEIPPEYKPEGDNIVWIPGYWWWDEDASDYLWVSGVWRAVPPEQQWVAGYWTEADGGFQWVSGFFTSQQPDQLVYQEAPPISLDNGPTMPAPSDEHFWNPGHWDTGYQWHAGYWQPLREDWVWIPSRWVATPHGCCFVPGHWDYQLASRGQLFAPVRFADPCPPQYVYQPTCAIQPSVLTMHLFVRPRWRTYCFGDWYDACSTGRIYSYANFHTGRFGYCPLFAYSRARYARNGINLALRLGGWNRYFTSNRGFRPRRTFASQRLFARQNRNRPFSNYVNIGVNLRDLALGSRGIRGGSRGLIGGSLAAGRNTGLRFQKINAQQIRRERERSQVIRTVAKQRAKRESVVSTSKVLQRGLARTNTSVGGRQRTDIFRDRKPQGRSSVSERSRTTVRSGNKPGGQINRSLSQSGSNRGRSNTSSGRNSSTSSSRRKTQLPDGIVKIQDKVKHRPAVGPKLPDTRTGRTKTTLKNGVVIRSQSPGKAASSSNPSLSRTRSAATTSATKSRNAISSRTRTPASQTKVNSRSENGSETGTRGTTASSRNSSRSRLGSSNRTRSTSTPSTRSRSNVGSTSSRTSPSSTRNKSTAPISSRSSSARSTSSATQRKSSTPPISSRSSRSSSNSSRTRSTSPPSSSRSRSSSSSSRSSSSPSIRSRSNLGSTSSRSSSSSTRSRSTPPISSRSGSSRSSSSSTRRQSSTPPSSSRSSRSSSSRSRSSSPSSLRSRSSSSNSRSSSSLSSRSRSNSSSARSSSSRSRSSSSSSRSGSSRSGGSSKSSSRSRRNK